MQGKLCGVLLVAVACLLTAPGFFRETAGRTNPEAAQGRFRLAVRVVDAADGQPVPCRLTVLDAQGAPAPLEVDQKSRRVPAAVRPGMAATSDGQAELLLAAGTYTVYASRGFEYSVAEAVVSGAAGRTEELHLAIRREVPTPGYAACDTHIHTVTHSGHGDCSLEERVVTIAAEGIELAISTEHDQGADYRPAARRLGVDRYFTSVIGSEVTTRVGHFNIFPVPADFSYPPAGEIPSDWPSVFSAIWGTPGVGVAVLNHPRDAHQGYRPFGAENHQAATAENLQGWRLQANAMEVVNSGALQSDPMQLFRDWFALLNAGFSITPVGSSDSHDVYRKLVGQGRTYVRCDDSDVSRIDVSEAVSNFRRGQVLVSMGLLTDIQVNGRFGPGDLAPGAEELQVALRVLGPGWTSADRVALYMNGRKVREEEIPPGTADQVLKWEGVWSLPPPDHDVFLAAIALGPGVRELYWRIPGPYQPTLPEWHPYVVGATGAVWVDGDGDGKASSAREYAVGLTQSAGANWEQLLSRLGAFDGAVATHVAGILFRQGRLQDPSLERRLANSPEWVRHGFEAFSEAQLRSDERRSGEGPRDAREK